MYFPVFLFVLYLDSTSVLKQLNSVTGYVIQNTFRQDE